VLFNDAAYLPDLISLREVAHRLKVDDLRDALLVIDLMASAGPLLSRGRFSGLRHDLFGGQLAVHHVLDARNAVVFGQVDGPDALGVAARQAVTCR